MGFASNVVRAAIGSALLISNAVAQSGVQVNSTVLILARDSFDVASISPALDAYAIPWQQYLIPQAGAPLPTLNSSLTQAAYGSIILIGSISYDYNGTYNSALTTAQWNQLYAYQTDFKVRMVRINEYPGPNFGTTVANANSPGCCDTGVNATISLTNTALIPGANLNGNQPVELVGLYHYPASITDTSTTTTFATFAPAGPNSGTTVAAVINNFSGREQMVWHTSFACDWSLASSYLAHSFVHWMTRSVFVGKRKLHLSPQVDDLQLSTTLYYPNNTDYKIGVADLNGHVAWQKDINSRLPAGSTFRLEFGHNGNGNLETATDLDSSDGVCNPDNAVEYPDQPDTPLEFMKPLGTGVDIWPPSFTTYGWSAQCPKLDAFGSWFLNPTNLNAFSHISHTFTHEELNNSTYHDAAREIQFNQAWLKQMGIDQATLFTANGIIPPAITGLHNGDVIQAWLDNGIDYVVGDNTRPVLRNPDNVHWPLASNVAVNGKAGLWIIPRFATTIYYNCEQTQCLLMEWYVLTQRSSGTFQDLLDDARSTNVQYLLNLMADPYMFHQANLRQADMPTITVGNQTGKMSLIMSWIETITQELVRLTNWPIISLKHQDFAQYFMDRLTVDQCQPSASYTYSSDGTTITAVTVTANGNTCSAPIPVTLPSGTATGGSFTVDQVGSEPPILWVTLSGSPVTLQLSNPVTLG